MRTKPELRTIVIPTHVWHQIDDGVHYVKHLETGCLGRGPTYEKALKDLLSKMDLPEIVYDPNA